MTKRSEKLISAALRSARKNLGTKITREGTCVYPAKPNDLQEKWWRRNRESAEKTEGIPPAIWDLVSVTFRKIVGISPLLEFFFMLGFVIGWRERGEQK